MRLKRYHTEIYVPEWGRNSVQSFCSKLAGQKLLYSYHANQKLKKMSKKYRQAINNLVADLDIANEIYLDYLFEFYADEENETKKACFRFPMVGLDADIILVISNRGTIVTVYINNELDKHHSLNENLYEKREFIMRAKLILRVREGEDEHFDFDGWIELILSVNGKKEYLLENLPVDNGDKQGFIQAIEDCINEATLLINAMRIKLELDESVLLFIEGSEEEIKGYVDKLMIQI